MITLKTIDMTLDVRSIEKAIWDVKIFRRRLQDALSDLARTLTAEGEEIARMYVIQMDAVWTGLLSETGIMSNYDERTHEGNIFSDLEYSVLVEYGTGIVGKENEHPGLHDPDWKNPESASIGGHTYSGYDGNDHGHKGWWYPASWGWWIPEKGKYAGEPMAWTEGMPARPFMYKTLKDLMEEAERRGATYIAWYLR